MSLEMAHKVILPPKKNYIPQFLKQRDINSYSILFYDPSSHFVSGSSCEHLTSVLNLEKQQTTFEFFSLILFDSRLQPTSISNFCVEQRQRL